MDFVIENEGIFKLSNKPRRHRKEGVLNAWMLCTTTVIESQNANRKLFESKHDRNMMKSTFR